jgi:serine/threonine-protein phosphatase 2A regulatory subunit A
MINLAPYFKVKMIYILEKLMAVEEAVVREKVVRAYVELTKNISKKEAKETLLPNVKKLSESSLLTTKISAIDIMTEIYPLCGEEEKKIIRSRFNVLFGEDSLMVKRTLASKLGTLCGFMKKSLVVSELIKSFKMLSNDDSAKVRIITIDSLVHLAECLSEDENKSHMIPIIINLTSDKSWRVKVHLAVRFSDISKAVGSEVSDSMVSIFATLLRDPEKLVRLEAVRSLSKFVTNLKGEKLISLIATIKLLAKDTVSLVRVAVAEFLLSTLGNGDLKQKLSKKSGMSSTIVAILKGLTQDDDLEVRLESYECVKNLTDFASKEEIEDLSNILKKSLDTSRNWRLRHSILNSLLTIAVKKADQPTFDKKYKKIFFSALKDPAEGVRSLAISYISKFAGFLNDNYLLTYLTVEMLTIISENENYNYQQRISGLYALKELYLSFRNRENMDQLFVAQVLPLLQDPVMNIRMVTLKMLKQVHAKSTNAKFKDQVKSAVDDMAKTETDNEIKNLSLNF